MAETVYTQLHTQNKIREAERKQQRELSKQIEEQERLKEEKEKAGFWEKLGATIADVFTELGGGLFKLGEGIVDAVIGVAGGVGSIFGADTQWAEDIIAFDATQEWYYGAWEDDFTQHSYINDAPIVKDVIRGVGQQLPTIAAIALAPVTGGGSLAALPYTIGATITSAGGSGMEEALNEDAEFGEAFAYGLLQSGVEGAVEFATAGMGKGITSIGKSVGKGVGKSAAKSVGKVMLEEAASEAIEEGLSALVNPLTKTTYQGSDALAAYGDMTFYLDAAQQALVGGIVGGITGSAGAVVNTKRAGGKANYSIEQSAQEIAALETKENNLWKNNKLNSKNIEQIETQRQAELNNISHQLQSMDAEARKATIEKYGLSSMFAEDGTIINQTAQETAQIAEGEQITAEEQKTSRKPLISDNIEAYSPSLRNTELIYAPTSNALSETSANAKKFITTINSNAKVVISESMPTNVDAFYDTNSKVFYLSNKATADTIAGHEFTHSLEGTAEYKSLADYILNNVENLEARIEQKKAQYAEVNKEVKQGENGEQVALYEAQTEIVAEEMGKLLSDPKAVERIVNQNKSAAHRIVQWIKDVIAKLTKKGTKGEYYNYIRTAEKLYANAVRNSVGGISLSDIAAFEELEKLAKQETEAQPIAKSEEKSYNESENKRYAFKEVKISKQEYAVLRKAIFEKNANRNIEQNPVDYASTANKFYVYENYGEDNFKVIRQLDIENDSELIKSIRKELKNESTIRDAKEFNSMLKVLKAGRRGDSNNNVISKRGQSDSRDGRVSREQSASESKSNTNKGDGNKRYALKDSSGKLLTTQQETYFKNSKITDQKGRLLVSYHGTDSNFYTFRNMPPQYGRAITDGFYFTLSKKNASRYGKNVKEVYLNIKNPFYLHNGNGVIAELADRDYTISRLKREFNVEIDEVGLPTPKGLKKVLQKLGYDGVVSDTINGDTNIIDTTYSETQIVAFKANQIKDIDNKYPTSNSDMRFSLNQDNNGNQLSKEQVEFFKDSKIRVKEVDGWSDTISEDGNLFEVYHGTNSDDFFVFDKGSIGSANDMGWYGKGYYFAFSESEAKYYGSRVMKCYLNIKNPFNFTEEMQSFDGVKDGSIAFDFGSFVLNLAEKFPDIAKKITTDYALKYNSYGESDIAEITFTELANKIKELYYGDRFDVVKFTSSNGDIYKYAIRNNVKNLDIDAETKKLIIDKRLDSDYMAKLAYEKKEINDAQFDKLLEIYEKYSYSELRDQYLYTQYQTKEEALKDKLSAVIVYMRDHIYRDMDMHMPEYYMQSIGNDFREGLIKKGYDGVIQSSTGDEVVAFYENQIKLTTNKTPTASEDIRYSLKDGEGDYNYSKGQIAKYVAEHSKLKAYSKTDAEQIINTIVSTQLGYGNKYGDLSNKTKNQVINTLWHALNTNNEGYRAKAVLDIADYIINNAVMEDMYGDANNEADLHIVGVLKNYLHKVDLNGIKGEIKYHYDNDNSPYLIWGKRTNESGQAPDQIAQEIAEEGIFIEAVNEADIFFEMDRMYRNATKNLKKTAKEKLADIATKEDLAELKQKIAKELLISFDDAGHKTMFANTIEKYTSKISQLKQAVKDIKAFNKAKNNAISTIERLRDEFVKSKPAGWKVPQQVADFVKKIARVETWRNNISKTAREHLLELNNQIDLVMDETQQQIYPFRETLRELGSGKGELTTQELQTLDTILRQFAWQLRNYNKVNFENSVQDVDSIAAQGVHESKQAKTILRSGSNVLIKFKNKVYTNPYDRLAEIGLYRENSIAVRLYKDMLQGDRNRAKLLYEVNQSFNSFFDKNKGYLKELQKTITLGDVVLTKRQALALYCTSLREQGKTHLFNQGYNSGVVRILDNKYSTQGKALEAFAKGKDITITADMIAQIKDSLTEADKAYLEVVDNFFNKISKQAKKETDQKLYGITNIEEGYYFPLKVSSDKIYTEAGQNNLNVNQYILDLGMNKSTKPHASNKIVIDGIDNIISNHLQSLSLYYGYAVPLTAYNRIMNRQVMEFEGADSTSNMRGEIQKIDADFEGYMNRLWQDVQGIRRSDKGFVSSLLSKIRWAGANSALGANPKVLVTQTLSLAAGISEFNPKYVAKGMGHFFGEKQKLELAKYSSLMWERMQIGNSVDIAEIRQIGKEIGAAGKITAKATKFLNDFTTKPISWMDSNVIQSLWFAAQYEVADTKGKGFEFGTEANKVEAGKRLDEVVFRTQQTSDPLGRSEWMRSQNEIVKFARMFTGDALQLTGRLISSVNKYNIAKKMIKSGDTGLVEQGQKMLSSAKKGVAKASSAFILNQAMLLAIAMAFKWIKGKNDDEEWSEIAKNEAIANIMGLIPFGGDIYDKLLGYEPTNMAYTALSNTVEIAQELYEGFSTLISGDYQDSTKRNAAIRKTALSISRLLGIPAQNLESYIKGVVGHVSPGTREEYEALFKTKSNAQYLKKIQQATADGNEELADTIINIMFDSRTGKIKDDKVLAEKRALIELGYDVIPKSVGDSITYDGIEYKLTSRQHSQFMKIYSQATEKVKNMVNTSSYEKLEDGAKAKAMNFIYNYYYNLAIEDLLGEDLEMKTILFAEAIPVEQLAMAIAQAQLYTADTDKDGKSISGTKKAKVQSFIQSLKLTATQKYMVMGYLGYSNKYGEALVKAYVNRLNLTKAQKEELLEMSGYVVEKNKRAS